MAASGNVRYSQLRSGDRSGTGAKVATVTGTLTQSKQLQFDANGNVVASSSPIGGSPGGSTFLYTTITVTRPTTTGFAWTNQGSSTIVTSDGFTLIGEATAAENLRLYMKAVPSVPYSIVLGVVPLAFSNHCGIVWKEASSGRIVTISFSAVQNVSINQYLTETSLNSTQKDIAVWIPSACFVKLVDDNTDRKVYLSIDGTNWILVYSSTRLFWLTTSSASHYGIYTNGNSTSQQTGIHLFHLVENP